MRTMQQHITNKISAQSRDRKACNLNILSPKSMIAPEAANSKQIVEVLAKAFS